MGTKPTQKGFAQFRPLARLMAVVMGLGLTVGVSPASAQDLALAAFYGTWKGSGISESEVSIHFRETARDLAVTIAPVDETTFSLETSTVQRQTGNPADPDERVKSSMMTFTQGMHGLWWDQSAKAVKEGGTVRWARIKDNALIINSFAIREDGRSELQTFRRAITDRGMDLTFTRTVDGELSRTVKGQLIKTAQ